MDHPTALQQLILASLQMETGPGAPQPAITALQIAINSLAMQARRHGLFNILSNHPGPPAARPNIHRLAVILSAIYHLTILKARLAASGHTAVTAAPKPKEAAND
jgi:hypothetical protein